MIGFHEAYGISRNFTPQSLPTLRRADYALLAQIYTFAISGLFVFYDRFVQKGDLRFAVQNMVLLNVVSLTITSLIIFRAHRIMELMNERLLSEINDVN